MLVFLEENSDYYSPLPYIRIVLPLRVIQTMIPMAIGEQAEWVNLSPPTFKWGGPGAQVSPFDVHPQPGWGRDPNYRGMKTTGRPAVLRPGARCHDHLRSFPDQHPNPTEVLCRFSMSACPSDIQHHHRLSGHLYMG